QISVAEICRPCLEGWVVIIAVVVLESIGFRRQVNCPAQGVAPKLLITSRSLPLVTSLMFCCITGVAQQNPQAAPPPKPVAVVEVSPEPTSLDPQIVEALKQISPERIRAT